MSSVSDPEVVAGLFCDDCAKKHVSKAATIFNELLCDRWNDAKHRMYFSGNLGEAEDHLGSWTDLGKRCRALRIEVEQMLQGEPMRDPKVVAADFVYLFHDIEQQAARMAPPLDDEAEEKPREENEV